MRDRLPVSVIIPVRDPRFFHEAIESVWAEHVAQVIVVSDGAENDGSRGYAALQQWSQAVALTTSNVFISTPKRGVGAARNLGLQQANEPWIALLDADDAWLPGKTQKQLDALHRIQPPLAFTSSLVEHFMEPGYELPETLRADKLGTIPLFFPSNLLCHRRTFDFVGGFDPNLVCANDVDWYHRANKLGVTRVHTDEVLVRKRIHNTNLSLSQGHDMQKQILQVLKRKVEARMFSIW